MCAHNTGVVGVGAPNVLGGFTRFNQMGMEQKTGAVHLQQVRGVVGVGVVGGWGGWGGGYISGWRSAAKLQEEHLRRKMDKYLGFPTIHPAACARTAGWISHRSDREVPQRASGAPEPRFFGQAQRAGKRCKPPTSPPPTHLKSPTPRLSSGKGAPCPALAWPPLFHTQHAAHAAPQVLVWHRRACPARLGALVRGEAAGMPRRAAAREGHAWGSSWGGARPLGQERRQRLPANW